MLRVALVGNPNCGKTSLFNALTGLRAKVANYPGITVDLREAQLAIASTDGDSARKATHVRLIDLPGLYGMQATSPEERVASDIVHGRGPLATDVLLIVMEATNLRRSLYLASELLELEVPAVIALNMIDEADSAGVGVEVSKLERELGCPVVPVSARSGAGLSMLRQTVAEVCKDVVEKRESPPATSPASPCQAACLGCSCSQRHDWADSLVQLSVRDPRAKKTSISWIDRLLTSPSMGLVALIAVMLSVFFTIFSLADVPMSLIEGAFGTLGNWAGLLLPGPSAHFFVHWLVAFIVSALIASGVLSLGRIKRSARNIFIALMVCSLVGLLPREDFRSLLIDGVIGGVAGVVVFLPQICILFFFISLLEDSGYMARGAFVMERILRHVGLPGKAFVPMLSSHACAIPGIMATRTIENWRDRLVTILVLPLLTCSARLPVYAMVAALLFGDSPWKASLMFAAAYLLGLLAACATALVLRRTVISGEAAPLLIELPPYRLPSLRNALLSVLDRSSIFLKKAGSIILLISVGLWALATYPKLPEAESRSDLSVATQVNDLSGQELAQRALEYSFAGRLGKLFEPVFAPLGFDWKINVGVISSFAAREVVVSTLSIIYGLGEEGIEDEVGLVKTLRRQTRPDGTPVFDMATSLSLLVFYVLAMQCLPTQVVTRRETNSWKWALFQLGYMTLLAYVAAWIVFQTTSRLS